MLLQPGVVGANRLIGVVIREDEKDVGLLSSIQGKSYPSEDEGDEFHDHEPTERTRMVKRSTARESQLWETRVRNN